MDTETRQRHYGSRSTGPRRRRITHKERHANAPKKSRRHPDRVNALWDSTKPAFENTKAINKVIETFNKMQGFRGIRRG